MAVNKRKRTPKRSLGINGGAKRTRLSYATRVLMGGGRLDSIEPIEVRQTFGRWMADRQRTILGER